VNPEQKIHALVMGKVVSTLRQRQGLTQQQLADEVGVAQATISRVERGTLIPDAFLLPRLSAKLGMTVPELLAHVDEGVRRTKEAATGALGGGRKAGQSWWTGALRVAGFAGLAGLVIFAVAAALSDES